MEDKIIIPPVVYVVLLYNENQPKGIQNMHNFPRIVEGDKVRTKSNLLSFVYCILCVNCVGYILDKTIIKGVLHVSKHYTQTIVVNAHLNHPF